MKKGVESMRCLKIENGKGFFVDKEGDYQEIDKMGKDDILYLLDIATDEDTVFEMDDMDVNEINNPAHRIIYQNLRDKFNELIQNKAQFLDESEALYKDALQKYQE